MLSLLSQRPASSPSDVQPGCVLRSLNVSQAQSFGDLTDGRPTRVPAWPILRPARASMRTRAYNRVTRARVTRAAPRHASRSPGSSLHGFRRRRRPARSDGGWRCRRGAVDGGVRVPGRERGALCRRCCSEVTQHECPWYGFAARTLSRVKCVACGADNKPGRRFRSQCTASLQGLCASCGAAYEEGERNGP